MYCNVSFYYDDIKNLVDKSCLDLSTKKLYMTNFSKKAETMKIFGDLKGSEGILSDLRGF